MTVAVAPTPARTERETTVSRRVFGLDAVTLHDAYWAARGVQCVRLGEPAVMQRAAELFLLLEPGQLVLFDLADLSDRLTWHDAAITRLGVIDDPGEHYAERVVRDAAGNVERIERRYGSSVQRTGRAILTSRVSIALTWTTERERRAAWQRVRRAVPWPRVDHARVAGLVARRGLDDQERRFLDTLVARWTQPDQSISGIEESPEGVWHIKGETVPPGVVRVGPLWLGRARTADPAVCLAGPGWLADIDDPAEAPAGYDAEPHPVFVREIAEVTPPEGGPRGERHASVTGQWYPIIKRAMDVSVAGAALLALGPVFLVIALLVLLEDGRPVLFGHRRQGRGGRPFRCWKFRTMHRNAEQVARDLSEYNVCDGPQFFMPDDPRVTRIGRVLRGSHLDELPQLWNVLVGQMSLVGPRPSPDDENQFCPAWRETRLSVRPGISGLWQLNRRREPGEDFQEWIRYDIEYVERASLRLDLKILAGTARIVLLGR